MFKNRNFKSILILSILFLFLLISRQFIPNNHFISWGDFRLETQWNNFFNKHFYIWSLDKSALNLDGILRIFSRSPLLIFYYIFRNNILVSYFFITLSFLFNGGVFYQLSKHILKLKNKNLNILISFLYAFNPVFLGNLSKTGLSIGTSALLGIITCLSIAFNEKRVFPMAIYIIFLFNISLIHPFHFLVNFGVFFIICIFLIFKNLKFVLSKVWQIFFSVFLAILVHMYAIAAIFSARSVSKEVLSNSIGGDASTLDLREIAVTDSFIEGLSLSKSIFKDFEFYYEGLEVLYFGFFSILIIGISLAHFILIKNKKYAKKANFFILIFITLIILTRGLNLEITAPFYNAINLSPLGWVFRSPLKWQFYVPLVLYPLLTLQFKELKLKKNLIIISIATTCIFTIISSVLIFEISTKLIKPKTQYIFNDISIEELKKSHSLLINSSECGKLARNDLAVYNELQHLFSTYGNTHLVLNEKELKNNINIYQNFDFVVACDKRHLNLEITQGRFKKIGNNNEYGIVFFENNFKKDKIYLNDYSYVSPEGFNKESNVLYDNTNKNINLISNKNISEIETNEYNPIINSSLESQNFINKTLAFEVLKKDLINNSIHIDNSYSLVTYKKDYEKLTFYQEGVGTILFNDQIIYDQPPKEVYISDGFTQFIKVNGSVIKLEDEGVLGMTTNIRLIELEGKNITSKIINNKDKKEIKSIEVNPKTLNFITLKSNRFNLENLISDGGFDNGIWESGLLDCFAYDDEPKIDYKYYDDISNPYLNLSAQKHIACISQRINTLPNTPLFISYKNRSNVVGLYGYTVGQFQGSTDNELMEMGSNSQWSYRTDEFIEGTANKNSIFRLRVTEGKKDQNNIVDFDDIFVANYPDINKIIFQKNEVFENSKDNSTIEFNKAKPSQFNITISNIQNNQFLHFKQRYDKNWTLKPTNGSIISDHFIGDQVFNSWYIDIEKACEESSCETNSDGSKNIYLTLTYKSQNTIEKGIYFSTVVILLLILYLIFDKRRKKN